MIKDPPKNLIFDGFSSLEGGVDAGRRPNVIGINQVVSAENCVFRGGFPTTRPGFRELIQNFVNPNLSCNTDGVYLTDNSTPAVTSQDRYLNGFFQCACYYSPKGGTETMVALIDGRLYRITPGDLDVTIEEIIPGTDRWTDRTFISTGTPTLIFGSPNIVSTQGQFVKSDINCFISGPGIPLGTRIVSVTSSSIAVMSNPAGSNQDNGTYRISTGPFRPATVRNRMGITKAFIIQADKWIIAQDGRSAAILYDNVTARRAKENEVPVGEIMAYGQGRIVVTRNGQQIAFGDLYGSHAGTDPGDSVIQFTEETFLSEGLQASLPFAMGKITAASFYPQLDTSTGLGNLLVFTDRGAAAFDLSLPRDQWKTSAFQQLALDSSGVRGWRSIVTVNEDKWFRASDGERNFRQARSEANGWYHIPLSTNVKQWLDNDTPEWLDYGSAIYFDNRLILTTTPVWNHGRVFHNGLLVLDFDILSSFGTNSRPAWNGHWSGIRVSQLITGEFKGRRRAFAFGLDENNQNQVYEITLNDRDDFDGMINGEMVARAFDFSKDQASNPFSEKELYSGDLWIRNVGDAAASISASFRPDAYPTWLPWDQHQLSIIGTYGPITPGIVPTMNPGFFPRLTLEKTVDGYDVNSTNRLLRRGFEFNVKFDWTGHITIERFRIHAQQLTERGRTNP